MSNITSFNNYVAEANKGKVHGWCAPLSFSFSQKMMEHQEEIDLHGAVCEIGVFQGKYFIGLSLLRQQGEIALAYDVFEDQHLSSDNYGGRAAEQVFRDNASKYLGEDDSIIINRQDSMLLTPEKIINDAGEQRIRFFSVDGSHAVEHTVNDLLLAQSAILPGGIVSLDDITNPNWPGVAEGVHRFNFFTPAVKIAPFALIANKLYLTTHSHHRQYFDYVKTLDLPVVKKPVKLWGYDLFSMQAQV